MRVSILLLASGRSERFGGAVPKVWLPIAGRTLVEHCLERLARVVDGAEVVLAVNPEHRSLFVDPVLDRLRELGVGRVVEGGATRQESVHRALEASDSGRPLVLVHDAARPLLPVAATRTALARAADVGGAVLAVPATDTLKIVGADGLVERTLPRSAIWHAQTPQVVRRELLRDALARAEREGFEATDDVSLLERADRPVVVVEGSQHNIKVTTRADLDLAEWLLRRETGGEGP